MDTERGFCLIGLDSTLKVGASSTQKWLFQWQVAEGELGKSQRAWLDDEMKKLTALHPGFDRFVKIVVLHHHPGGIEGTAPGDRFMQLLDAADAKKLFERTGVNVILHGHKHVPHERRIAFDGAGHYTLIGAGTALCSIRGEDANEGNNFNVVSISPKSNIVEIQRYKANQERQFVKSGNAAREALFPTSASGYRMRRLELFTKIVDMNGRCVDSTRRTGVFVDGPRSPLPKTAFRWSASSAVATILDFEYDTESIVTVEYQDGQDTNNARTRKGAFILTRPLEWGGLPIDMWWSFEVDRAFCMRKADLASFYPGGTDGHEGILAEMVHPAETLVLTIEFPRKFWPTVEARCVDRDRSPVPLPPDSVLPSDRLSSRHTLTVRRPLLGHEYGLWWVVP